MPLVHAPAHVARVLFDEAHGEAWTISRDRAAALQPAHPQDSSYADAAQALAGRELAVAAHREGQIDATVLGDVDVLVIAHPSEPKWEKTDGASPVFTVAEIDAIEAWVRAGGGLVVLGETEQDKYGTNLGELVARFDLGFANTTVYDYSHQHDGNPAWILGEPGSSRTFVGGADLLARVEHAAFYRSGALELRNGAMPILRTSASADPAGAPVMAATTAGAGRVAVFADSDLFGDDCLGDLDHRALWVDTITWAAQSAFARAGGAPDHGTVVSDRHWLTLKAEVDALRLLQDPDGSVDTARHDRDDLGARVARIADAIAGLRAALPAPSRLHRRDDRRPAPLDPGRLRTPGLLDRAARVPARPAPPRRLAAPRACSRCTRRTARGTPASRRSSCEVPWPDWLAELEATRYDNPKFVPVTFVDRTAGYDSECAVLFPETFAVASPAGEPLRRDLLRPRGRALPPRLRRGDRGARGEPAGRRRGAARLASHLPGGVRPLGPHPRSRPQPRRPAVRPVHDPPADAVLDVLAGGAALRPHRVLARRSRSRREGFAFARHVQTAILFDRLFRFPVTGTRVRNYDGLGGQLLFAFLHERGTIRWTDNRLTIDWKDVADGVVALREKVEALYRTGIDLPKVRYWMTAHDLVSTYVAPRVTSALGRRRRRRCATSPIRRRGSTPCRTTSSRSASSTRSCSRSSSRPSRAGAEHERRERRAPRGTRHRGRRRDRRSGAERRPRARRGRRDARAHRP